MTIKLKLSCISFEKSYSADYVVFHDERIVSIVIQALITSCISPLPFLRLNLGY